MADAVFQQKIIKKIILPSVISNSCEESLFKLSIIVTIILVLASIIHEGYQNRNFQSKIEVIATLAR